MPIDAIRSGWLTLHITIGAAVDDAPGPAEPHPLPDGPRLRDLPELLRSLPHLSEEEAAAFAEDVEKARAEMNTLPDSSGWQDAD
ncbi:MAG TPA: hypothetical protein VHG08_26410 [Longimicrobium sp.]|nr:hypothetical protein [Longimicrobium sp.]